MAGLLIGTPVSLVTPRVTKCLRSSRGRVVAPPASGRHAGAPVDFEVVQANGSLLPLRDRAAHHRAPLRPAQDVQQEGSFGGPSTKNEDEFHHKRIHEEFDEPVVNMQQISYDILNKKYTRYRRKAKIQSTNVS